MKCNTSEVVCDYSLIEFRVDGQVVHQMRPWPYNLIHIMPSINGPAHSLGELLSVVLMVGLGIINRIVLIYRTYYLMTLTSTGSI